MSIKSSRLIWMVSCCATFLQGRLVAEVAWATLNGRFVCDGTPPTAKFLDTSGKDSATCAKHKIPDETLIVDSASRGIANVVVFARKTSRVHESQKSATSSEAVFNQKECVFLNRVLPVRVEQPILIKNSDPDWP